LHSQKIAIEGTNERASADELDDFGFHPIAFSQSRELRFHRLRILD
jgi:hypothetical protein